MSGPLSKVLTSARRKRKLMPYGNRLQSCHTIVDNLGRGTNMKWSLTSLRQTDTPKEEWNTKWGPGAKSYPEFKDPECVKDRVA